MTIPEESARGAEFTAEEIAEEYEEDATLPGPEEAKSLLVRIRKIEERLATIEQYLGSPPPEAGTLEERLSGE